MTQNEENIMVTKFKLSALSICLALIVPSISFAVDTAKKEQNEAIDTVYTLSNNVDKNEVLAFQRSATGAMTAIDALLLLARALVVGWVTKAL